VGAIVNCRATPILVDVGEDHNMDVSQVEAAVSPRTRAIIPVHLNGRICDMAALMDIAQRNNLVVIEDAAQALGATFNGKKAGSFGLASCFSFYPAKMLGTAGDGGMVVTDSEEAAARLRALRDNGRVMGQDEVVCYGFNSRLDNLHAAMLNVKLKYLPGWIERRREIARLYDRGLSDLPQIKLPPAPQNGGPYFDVYQNYVIRCQERDRLAAHLRDSGVEVLISWPIPMHHQKALALGHFHLPETERISREVISLPCYPELSDDKAEYVIEAVHGFYG
jgi:aminotransferase EvaB